MLITLIPTNWGLLKKRASRIPRAFPLGEGGFSANCLQFVEKTDEVLLVAPQKPSAGALWQPDFVQNPVTDCSSSDIRTSSVSACGAMSKSSILPWQSRLSRDRQALGLPPCRATFPRGEGFGYPSKSRFVEKKAGAAFPSLPLGKAFGGSTTRDLRKGDPKNESI